MTSDDTTQCEGWTHGTLLAFINSKFKELDLRYEQRFKAQETALEKAETAQESKNQTLNELRGVVTDQQGAFARTTVVNLQIEAITARMGAMELDVRGMKERGTGLHAGIGYLIGLGGLLIAGAAVYLRH